MKKGIVFLGAMFALVFLSSCTTVGVVTPKAFPGADKIFSVNDEGTVNIKGVDLKSEPTHWLYVQCEHWAGCYMRCQGPIGTCKEVANKSELEISHTASVNGP